MAAHGFPRRGDVELVERHDTMAVTWYRRAADQGYAQAQYNLGICYSNGQGVEQDHTVAFTWFSQAADQGFAKAQRHWGVQPYAHTKRECGSALDRRVGLQSRRR